VILWIPQMWTWLWWINMFQNLIHNISGDFRKTTSLNWFFSEHFHSSGPRSRQISNWRSRLELTLERFGGNST
jgi:hypothetical protein